MRLRDYAKKNNVTYRTAWNHWKSGKISGHILDTGTIIIDNDNKLPNKCLIYCRVSSSENKCNLDTQSERLQQYAVARGYEIYKVVKEVGSGINDQRRQLLSTLTDKNYNRLIVEHKDRLSRFGVSYIDLLLQEQGKVLDIVNYTDNSQQDLIQDFVSIITSFCARLYGLRRSKRKTEQLIRELTND